MKKLIPFLIAVMLVSCVTVTASAESVFNIAMTPSVTTAKPGDTFTVAIYANSITDPLGIIGLDMQVAYDTKRIVPVSKECVFPAKWDATDDLSPAFNVDESGEQSGVRRIVLIYDGVEYEMGAKDDNTFGIIATFKVLDNAPAGNATIQVPTGKNLTATNDADKNDPTKGLSSVTGNGNAVTIAIESDIIDTSPSVEPTAAPTAIAPVITNKTDAAGTNAATKKVDDNSTPATTAEKAEKNDDNILLVIGIIVAIVIIAVGVFAVVRYRSKNDDSNPVNPG